MLGLGHSGVQTTLREVVSMAVEVPPHTGEWRADDNTVAHWHPGAAKSLPWKRTGESTLRAAAKGIDRV